MSKTCKYTILTLFLALVFSIGSMACVNLILREREKHLLAEGGRAVIEEPIRKWQGQDRYTLTIEKVEEAIENWYLFSSSYTSPLYGGMVLEWEAVEEAKEWLAEMGMDAGQEEQASVETALGLASHNTTDWVEPYYYFWRVELSGRSYRHVLYVNAVSGKVWRAELKIYKGSPQDIPVGELSRFVELAGLQASSSVEAEGEDATLGIDGSERLRAERKVKRPDTADTHSIYGRDGQQEGIKKKNQQPVSIYFGLGIAEE